MNLSANKSLSPLIDAVTRNGFCTGCGLCESIAQVGAVQMRISAEGYLRPVVMQALTEQATDEINAVCPGIRVEHLQYNKKNHPIWGPLFSVNTGHAIDPEIRKLGSSGGVISAIANYLLSSGKVDFVAQIATSHSDPLANEMQISYTREDVLRAAGSRYSPSAPLRGLRDLLATGKKFAFVGKPCDVAALRRYAEINSEVKQQVLYMFSFMCAGVPSIKGTHEVIKQLGADIEKVISFRYRGDGWPGMAKAVEDDGKSYEMDYTTSWGTVLNKYLQFRCKICPDGTGEFADIVCADAWYGADGYPDFTERDGRTLILARTAVGQLLLDSTCAANNISITPISVDEIKKMQPYQVERKQMVLGRILATRLAYGTAPIYRNLRLIRASLQTSGLTWLRSAWGTFKRTRKEQQ